MNQFNPDLEVNLLQQQAYYLDNHSPVQNPDAEREEEVVQQSPFQTGSNNFDDSPRFNIISLMISVSKIIASTIVLLIMPHDCMSLSQIWIFCMLLHDTFNISVILMRLKNIYVIRSINVDQTEAGEQVEPEHEDQNNMNQEPNGVRVQQENQGENENRNEMRQQGGEDEFVTTTRILNRMRRIKILNHICLWFWSALFVTGICLNAFLDLTPCQTLEINHLLIAYLIMGGLWLFSPVLLLVIGCVCLPVLLLIVWMIGRPKPANNAAVKKLPVIKYSSNTPGEKECVICMVEYQEGDKLVQLRCNDRHHFHEKCGKKWLKINGQCPMCRQRIDEKVPESDNQPDASSP